MGCMWLLTRTSKSGTFSLKYGTTQKGLQKRKMICHIFQVAKEDAIKTRLTYCMLLFSSPILITKSIPLSKMLAIFPLKVYLEYLIHIKFSIFFVSRMAMHEGWYQSFEKMEIVERLLKQFCGYWKTRRRSIKDQDKYTKFEQLQQQLPIKVV